MPFYDQATETAPRERLRTLQFQKLQKLLREISGRNRFYTKKWKETGIVAVENLSFPDFQKLPFTHKSELTRAQEEAPPVGTNATFPVDAYARIHQTSGTTGTPLRVVDTPESWEWWGDCWGHVLRAAGVTSETLTAGRVAASSARPALTMMLTWTPSTVLAGRFRIAANSARRL